MLVFQLTWDDVTSLTDSDRTDHAWRPYLGGAQRAARQRYQQLGGRGDELDELIWTNPMRTLLAVLGDPDVERWRLRAEAVLTGLLAHEPGRRELVTTNSDGAPERLQAALRGDRLPASRDGKITLLRHVDTAGCPVVVAVDQRDPSAAALSGFIILDDRKETIEADPQAHRERWAAWLRWGDIMQFLAAGNGDGMQLALSEVDLVDPVVLKISGGTGAFPALCGEADDAEPVADVAPASLTVDVHWRSALDLLDPEEPGLASLARGLADRGVPAPAVGFELGGEGWQAELAWPQQQIAVFVDLDAHGAEEEQRRRDAAYQRAGWETRLVRDWSVDDLAERILADVKEGSR
jgi:hypothetical protein